MNAILLNGTKIENIIVVEALEDFEGAIEYIDGASIGDEIINGGLVKAVPVVEPLTKSQLKALGAPYGELQIPFTNEDAIGMMQVAMAFQMGITHTNINFSNGEIMPISATDFGAFALWFATNRNEFFL